MSENILDKKWRRVRQERNSKLDSSDVTQLVDRQNSMTTFEKEQWRDYRQALRDVPNQTSDPDFVVWPQEPS